MSKKNGIATLVTRSKSMNLEIPLGPVKKWEEVPHPMHVDCHLSGTQDMAMTRMFEGLTKKNAQLANGKLVKSRQDVIRWLLDNI